MGTEHNVRLTSAEISQLWTSYMNDSFTICIVKYFLNNVEDTEIKSVLKYALELAESHIPKLTKIFNYEKFPIPQGFNVNQDVNVNAPRLFSDTYYLNFIAQYGKIGLNANSEGVALAVRDDVDKYYTECLTESMKLHRMANEVLLSKGLYVRPPNIPMPEDVEFVKKKSFLAGFFGDVRPLSALEITNLYANIQRNALGTATLIGYIQVTKNKDVKEFLVQGKDISVNAIESFGQKLKIDNLPIPMTWDGEVTESTTNPFSDKLIMFQICSLISIGLGYYGLGLATSPRRDIGLLYNQKIVEIQPYASKGAKIMIENEWMEQPPLASDRDKLANQ
ncbi:DUF3231 family protein [Peribacillus asahii]|uniref:DUF3231 family protein n=1 Tax=Peribacillus asahii TaxID=228899 RepID=UPI0020799EFB|nr:DUF3231 family protein [Peribacillus asahii]USK60850.1 DUF3231 family protein [Peribacillus asahii]